MTLQELGNLGIYLTNNEQLPRECFVPYCGNVIIFEHYTINDIYKMMYEKGKSDGIKLGSEKKSDEIKKCLGIN